MPTRCIKIRLKDGSSARLAEWADELNRRADEVLARLQVEGISLEAAFLDSQVDGLYLIYVIHADDPKKASAVARRSSADIDNLHETFKAACWENRCPLKPLIDFACEPVAQNSSDS
jgi:hypothetical protein